MSESATTPVESDVVDEIVRQMRALDTHGLDDRVPAEQVLAPFIVTKEQRRAIPVVGDPDEAVMARVKAYYNALSVLIEKAGGLMAIPMIDLSHEGFGRALITVGSLVVHDRTLRDVHRFGFPTREALEEEAGKVVAQAAELVRQYEEVARL